jgi:hypothetical protein
MGDCFAPLGLNGAEPHTDRHGNSMKELAQWGRFNEKKTYLDTSQFLLPPPPPPPKVVIWYINFSCPERSSYIFILSLSADKS